MMDKAWVLGLRTGGHSPLRVIHALFFQLHVLLFSLHV